MMKRERGGGSSLAYLNEQDGEKREKERERESVSEGERGMEARRKN